MPTQQDVRRRIEKFRDSYGSGWRASLIRASRCDGVTIDRFLGVRESAPKGVQPRTLDALEAALDQLERDIPAPSPQLSKTDKKWATLRDELIKLAELVAPESPLSPKRRIAEVDKFAEGWDGLRVIIEGSLAERKDSF